MANLILDYNLGTDSYSDGAVEDTIYSIVKEGRGFEELTEQELVYPIVYHLSNVRENILLWYNFDPDASALEIGSGCGAITGLLCRKLKHVTSVELSQRRAEINYERNKEYDNLDLIVSNFNDLKLDKKYEYIILNGVYEYASSYTHSDNPYVDFLTALSAYLSPKGKLLIAIENRLGAKYFAGAPEDHLDTFFTGINGYPGVDTVRTFSKTEWKQLSRAAGFEYLKFYYPYPDYKFPQEIFTDASIQSALYGRKCDQYSKAPFDFIDESNILKSLSKEGVADVFANSFLIELAREDVVDTSLEEIVYVKLNADRNDAFQIYTKIWKNESGTYVSKCSISPAGQSHIDRMKRINVEQSLPYELLKDMDIDAVNLVYPFLEERSLDALTAEFAAQGDSERIINMIQDVYKVFLSEQVLCDPYDTPQFQLVFGDAQKRTQYKCVKNVVFDIILDNIFVLKEKMVVIDYEWFFDFFIPSEYIMWRLINELYFKHPELYNLLDRKELEAEYGIQEEDETVFRNWEYEFAYQYVGSNKLRKIAKIPNHINLEDAARICSYKSEISSKLYFDEGDGFSENDVLVSGGKIQEGHFLVEFLIPERSKPYHLRWDPIDEPCICENISVFVDDKNWEIFPNDAIINQGRSIFIHEDPYFVFAGELQDVKRIRIEGELFLFDQQQFSKYVKESKENENAREQVIQEKDELIARQSDVIMEKDGLIAHQSDVITEKDELIAHQSDVITEKDSLIAQQAAAVQEKDNEIKEIKMSKLWFLYRVKNYLKRRLKRQVKADSNNISNVRYAVDACNYNGHLLLVKGWVFSLDGRIDQLSIFIEAGTQSGEVIIENYPQSRLDVKEAFQNELALDSGFQTEAELEFTGEAVISLKINIQNNIQLIEIGRVQSESGRDFLCKRFRQSLKEDLENLILKKDFACECEKQRIDVIVPIYNGYSYLPPLFEGLQRTSWDADFYLIDDKSPDTRVRSLMEEYAQHHPNVHLIYNEENLGFLPTVNKGLEMTSHHVAIVNTDVELPECWLERLMLPIILDKKVASSTPFSNSATIFSFPNFCENNHMYHGLNIDELDSYFKRVIPQYTVVPTGMGFCMGMNRETIQKIGVLDEKTFSKGYGEENDWCQRAIKAGYVNVHVENLFVYHKHGGSFSAGEKQRLLDENLKKLEKKHPNYFRDVSEYCSLDPVKKIRNLVRFMIDVEQSQKINNLAFDHNWGGGATAYLEQRIIEWNHEGMNTAIVRYDFNKENYKFRFVNQEFQVDYELDKLEDLNVILQYMVPETIYINELVTYPKLFQTLSFIKEITERTKARLVMLMHDYFPICPSINLLTATDKYCREGKNYSCEECFARKEWKRDYACEDISTWHTSWHDFLSVCDEVRTFSEDSFNKVKSVYSDLTQVTLVPHKVEYMPAINKNHKITNTINIGLLGVLTVHKGRELIKELLEFIAGKDYNIRFILIGKVDDGSIEASPFFEETGDYSVEQLPQLVLEKDIDLFFIPSIWPETFSYTTEEIMKMNLPVVSYKIGAPAERIAKYAKGCLLEDMSAEKTMEGLLDFIEALGLRKEIHDDSGYVLFVAEYISFSSRYRVEHAQEELLFAGVKSRFLGVEELDAFSDFDNVESIVIYRCRYQKPLVDFMEKLENVEKHIPVLYDIDDYIFDYENIKEMEFLAGDEYEGFEEYSSAIEACMKKCNAFITSTVTLGQAIEKHFPGKPVLVNRNVASMAMFILSQKALIYKKTNTKEVVLGYFSGSQTHNHDFELIEDAIVSVMNQHPNVKLLIVGCLELSSKFNPLWDRIERREFMPWQQLPMLIAEVDINLMPLESTFFNECKSENKWMEAALVKTMTVASCNKEIEAVVKNNENIILCRNDIEDWVAQLDRMIEDGKQRAEIAENAYQYVCQNKITKNSYEQISDFLTKMKQ